MARREDCSVQRTKKPVDSGSNHFEPLESRRLMTTAGLPNYTSFVHTAGLDFNGYNGAAVTSNHTLQLTDGNPTEARDAWYTTRVSIDSFSTTFSFVTTGAKVSADGFTFAIQNNGLTSLGVDGHDLGYAGAGTKSVGIGFNLYNFSAYGSQFGFLAKGQVPVTTTKMGNVDLHDGDLFTASLSYDGETLSVRVVDTAHPSDVFTDSEKINISSIIGAHSAYVGFTGATGVQFATQKITSWTYGYGPSISSLTASPSTVTKHVSTLTATATDPIGTKNLVYDWNLVSAPAGARTVTFSTTSSTADDTTVTVFSTGDYVFQVTVKDKNGYTATDDVTVVKS